MMIMIIFTLANLIVAVLGRATVLLVGRVEESSSGSHCHVRPCRHYHLQQKLDLASLPKANENMKDLGQLVIAIGDSKVQWSQPMVLLALQTNKNRNSKLRVELRY